MHNILLVTQMVVPKERSIDESKKKSSLQLNESH